MKTRLILACCVAMCTIKTALCAYPELLWDMDHINEMSGDAKLTLHHPDFHEVVMVHDAPWEGNVCCYHTVLYDGVKYRMYYRGAAYKLPGYGNHQVTCYAKSDDGIHWVKPNLGLYEFNGSKENNIILMNDGDVAHNFSPCFDTNPACPPEQRYKALGGQNKGLFLYYSPDGIHWSRAQEEPVLTQGAFDSQNTLFYDSVNNRYVANSRCFYPVKEGFSARCIQRNISEDAIHWSKPERLDYGAEAPSIELYTNGIHPYVNNPSVYIGLPKRFNRTRCSIYDKSDAGGIPGVSDGGFMSSRDALHYHRWDEAFIRPGIQHERWVNRNNMCALGVVLTKADLEGTPPVLTIYSTEGYYGPTPNSLRRLTIRQDGFVSIHAPLTGGAFTMKPLEVVVSGTTDISPKQKRIQIVSNEGMPVLKVDEPCAYTLPVESDLGTAVSFAITVNKTQPGSFRRLFSSYSGGENKAGERKFILDFQVGRINPQYGLLRFWYDGMEVAVPASEFPDWKAISQGKLTVVATYDNGIIKLYVNGKLAAEGGQADHGNLTTPVGPVRFGEDYPPTSTLNEPFLGEVHEMAVVKRVLTAAEVETVASDGLKAVLTVGKDSGVYYDMSGDNAFRLFNQLNPKQAPLCIGSDNWGEVMLLLNASTSALGEIRCEIRDEQNNPIPGYSLEDSHSIFGDELDLAVSWKNGPELKSLLGRKVILHFELKDADIYSFRFGKTAHDPDSKP